MTTLQLPHGIKVDRPASDRHAAVLEPGCLAFLAELHARFEPRRRERLQARQLQQARLDAGERFEFLPGTREIREGGWRVREAPVDLMDRRVEITGPAEAKTVINALNSGAQCFMADLEDASVPTWTNVLEGQAVLRDAVRGTLSYTSPAGKAYALRPTTATLLFRPRGWHLEETHARVGGEPMSASLFDAGVYLWHNAKHLLAKGSGPYLYLPKMESHHEARLWHDVLGAAEDLLGIPRNSTCTTVLVETLPAAFQMQEILYALRERSCALNAGRWDYMFSCIKATRARPLLFPDRHQLTMAAPFMRAYAQLLVQACHARGAHAIGGMSAFVPDRSDPARTEAALAQVRADKQREASDGFDGAWVAHPALVPVALGVFRQALGGRIHQLDRRRADVRIRAHDLLDFRVPGQVTEAGVRANLRVGMLYLASWLQGRGAVAIDALMEDTATAEIARAQLWQWSHHGARLEDGSVVTPDRVRRLAGETVEALAQEGHDRDRIQAACDLLEATALAPQIPDFLTVTGAQALEASA